MTDALNEALMKLAVARPAPLANTKPLTQDQNPAPPAQIAEPAEISPQPELVLQPEPVSQPNLTETTSLPVSAPLQAPVKPVSFKLPTSAAAVLQRLQGLRKLQDLRGWVAAGIALALLVTIWDDLNRDKSRTGNASGEASAVDIDSLLDEFETAEPAAQRTVSTRSSAAGAARVDDSNVMANYSATAADYSAAPSMPDDPEAADEKPFRQLRFTGSIQQLP